MIYLLNSNRIEEDLVRQYPEKYGLVESLAAFRTSLALAYASRGDLDRAENCFEQACRSLRAVVAEHPEAENAILFYGGAMDAFSWFMIDHRGDVDRFFALRRDFDEAFDRLRLPGVSDVTHRRIPAAFARLETSRVLARLGRFAEARRVADEAGDLVRSIADDPASANLHENNFGICAFEIGLMSWGEDPSSAKVRFRQSIEYLRPARQRDEVADSSSKPRRILGRLPGPRRAQRRAGADRG